MTAPAVTRVLRALDAGNVDVRFVGGAVRNAVMNLAVRDVDIATPDIPARVIERLTAAGLKAVPTGLDHGTVMAVADGGTFEITTLRKDTACDGRHAAVEFTADWREDARRRDFTFNAMSMRPDGAVFDDHGGWDDAKAGRVVFVGAPADRIREDYLRILRLFRFFAWYGRVPLDAATLQACRDHAAGLDRLSGERVRQELSKLLEAPAPFEAVKLMADSGVLARVVPEARDIAPLKNLVPLEKQGDWLRRLAVLLPDDGAAQAVADRLKLSNVARGRLAALTAASTVHERMDPQALRRALYHDGAALVTDRALLAWARTPSEAGLWRALLEEAAAWTPKTLPVGGGDVLGLGVTPGPAVGRLLAAVEDWWIGAGFAPGRGATLAQLKHWREQLSDP
ncbi:MAG: CCA tRNA nucleotidyltransferase [Rhodospirillaceae bacterium]|nr:CCA tRNA nucleotidyltransferase [Rhodospirillaceae bacterium]